MWKCKWLQLLWNLRLLPSSTHPYSFLCLSLSSCLSKNDLKKKTTLHLLFQIYMRVCDFSLCNHGRERALPTLDVSSDQRRPSRGKVHTGVSFSSLLSTVERQRVTARRLERFGTDSFALCVKVHTMSFALAKWMVIARWFIWEERPFRRHPHMRWCLKNVPTSISPAQRQGLVVSGKALQDCWPNSIYAKLSHHFFNWNHPPTWERTAGENRWERGEEEAGKEYEWMVELRKAAVVRDGTGRGEGGVLRFKGWKGCCYLRWHVWLIWMCWTNELSRL